MAGKGYIRSIRFSDDLAQLIEQQVGNSFTEKYENLITRCVWELPQKEAELKRIQEKIQQERKQLADLRKRREKLDRVIQSIQQNLDYQLKDLERL